MMSLQLTIVQYAADEVVLDYNRILSSGINFKGNEFLYEYLCLLILVLFFRNI